MTFRLGIDIGGTFTDFALFDERGSKISVAKRLTTPTDPSIAVIEGTAALLQREAVPMAEVESIAHGTTLVTNAVIERRGARTGMLVTAGFRDILDMGFEQRYDLFDLRLTWPDPLVPRRLRREVPERVGHDGQVVTPLDPESTRAAVRDLVDSAGIEALAICFLHSYANPVHEEAAGELVRSEFPELHVSRSAEVFGNMREYERWTTATMNACTQPMFDRYIERLERGLADLGFGGRLFVMTSSGASIVPETARRFPVRALESGPAAGALMSAHHGRTLGHPDLLSFDMGGTTAKGALVRGFTALKRYDMEVGRIHEFKSRSGLIEVTLPDDGARNAVGTGAGAGYADAFARLDELFQARYAEIFSETFLDEPLEIVSWKVEAAGEEATLAYAGIAGGARAREKHPRNVWFGDAFVECEVLDRYALEPGTAIKGPAVIEERESTCVLGPGDQATVDAHLNLVAELAGEESDS